jgi:uncharacterized protein YbjT (DUF2867 family)
VEDVARVLAALLANPQPHIGRIYHLTGPQLDFIPARLLESESELLQ